MSERIMHAAVKAKNGWMFFGKCHADCFYKAHNMKIEMEKGADAQGFLTSEGRFVCRALAAVIALNADQVDDLSSALFSEDLWCERDGGKHNYCELEGYKLKTRIDEAEKPDGERTENE